MTIIEGDWYKYPHLFDLAFRSETRLEADFLEAAFQKYARRQVRSLLEPACGSGRLVAEMASRGYRMAGFDVSQPMLDYARRRLKRRELSARLFDADMAEFRLPRPVDAAFNTFNSFRHLLTEQAARRFLENTAEAVRPGGIFVLGLHLVPLDAEEGASERWTARHGRTRLTVTLRVTNFNRRERIEQLRVSSLVRSNGKTVRLRSEFPYRLYTAAQLKRLLASVPQWELCDVFDFWYEIDQPRKLDDQMSDTVLVLRRRPRG
ncbi:MAG TPA: class I SAM-dependent methyltransferase [Pirellulaceae bacterium]|nr:class I SAM-dependent methyltransferase [Pirellulaceae bacterium]